MVLSRDMAHSDTMKLSVEMVRSICLVLFTYMARSKLLAYAQSLLTRSLSVVLYLHEWLDASGALNSHGSLHLCGTLGDLG